MHSYIHCQNGNIHTHTCRCLQVCAGSSFHSELMAVEIIICSSNSKSKTAGTPCKTEIKHVCCMLQTCFIAPKALVWNIQQADRLFGIQRARPSSSQCNSFFCNVFTFSAERKNVAHVCFPSLAHKSEFILTIICSCKIVRAFVSFLMWRSYIWCFLTRQQSFSKCCTHVVKSATMFSSSYVFFLICCSAVRCQGHRIYTCCTQSAVVRQVKAKFSFLLLFFFCGACGAFTSPLIVVNLVVCLCGLLCSYVLTCSGITRTVDLVSQSELACITSEPQFDLEKFRLFLTCWKDKQLQLRG